MSTRTLDVTLDIGDRGSEVDVELVYRYYPAEPFVWHYADGGGHPGYPAYVELLDAMVVEWRTSGRRRSRSEGVIWSALDDIAWRRIQQREDHYRKLCIADAEDSLRRHYDEE